MNSEITSLLRPEILRSLKGLELLSKKIIGAFLQGANQSLRSGEGLEFKQYRSYQPGDDLRLLDWKMYARSDRFYIKEAEVDTHLHVRFVLDSSASMLHEDSRGLQKMDIARLLIASLAYLAIEQGDAVGLNSLNNQKIEQFPVKTDHKHFQRLLYALLQIGAAGKFPQDTALPLPGASSFKEMLIFVSDAYQHQDEIYELLRQWQSPGNELLFFHLMADNELDLSYRKNHIFEDLETGRRVAVNPRQSKAAYFKNRDEKLARIRQTMLEQGISYTLLRTDQPLDEALRLFLRQRKKVH